MPWRTNPANSFLSPPLQKIFLPTTCTRTDPWHGSFSTPLFQAEMCLMLWSQHYHSCLSYSVVLQHTLTDLIFGAVTDSVTEISGEFVAVAVLKPSLARLKGTMRTRSHCHQGKRSHPEQSLMPNSSQLPPAGMLIPGDAESTSRAGKKPQRGFPLLLV